MAHLIPHGCQYGFYWSIPFQEKPLSSWKEILKFHGTISEINGLTCLFRGLGSWGPELKSSLERIAIGHWERPWQELPDIEEGLIRHFQRQAAGYIGHPFELNTRLVVQQGVFLVPGNVTVPYEENLGALGDRTGNAERLTLRLNVDELKNARLQLRRMNVSEATLFPGLDGRHLTPNDDSVRFGP